MKPRLHILLAGALALVTGGGPRGIVAEAPGPGEGQSQSILSEEEELVYEVTWAFITLGTVRLVAKPDLAAHAWIDSREGLPYVDLHSRYHTQMDSSLYSAGSSSLDRQEDGTWNGLMYHYDTANRRLIAEKTRHREPAAPPFERGSRDTLMLKQMQFMDGLSIAYLPRTLIHTNRTVEIPTMLHGTLGTTTFYLPGEKTTVDLDAVEYPVKAIEMEGTTTVVGVYGMSGDFTGWFSDDACAVPLRGRLNVLLGSVSMELVRWKRKNWIPPR